MGARKPVCLGSCQLASQVTQSRTGAEFPRGASVSLTLGPRSPCTSDGKLWAWISVLLGANEGAFCPGPRGSLRQEQPGLGAFFLGLGGCRRKKMGEFRGQREPGERKGRKLEALTGLTADRVDLCLGKLRKDLS